MVASVLLYTLGAKFVIYSSVLYVDLCRMHMLMSSTEKGMAELKNQFEKHVLAQGILSVESCHEIALSVRKSL